MGAVTSAGVSAGGTGLLPFAPDWPRCATLMLLERLAPGIVHTVAACERRHKVAGQGRFFVSHVRFSRRWSSTPRAVPGANLLGLAARDGRDDVDLRRAP